MELFSFLSLALKNERGIETPGNELTLGERDDKNDIHFKLVNSSHCCPTNGVHDFPVGWKVYHMPKNCLRLKCV